MKLAEDKRLVITPDEINGICAEHGLVAGSATSLADDMQTGARNDRSASERYPVRHKRHS